MNKRIRIIKHAGRDAQRDNKDATGKQEGVSSPEIVSSLATGQDSQDVDRRTSPEEDDGLGSRSCLKGFIDEDRLRLSPNRLSEIRTSL